MLIHGQWLTAVSHIVTEMSPSEELIGAEATSLISGSSPGIVAIGETRGN